MFIGSVFTKCKLLKQNAENTNVIQDPTLLVECTHLEILQLEKKVNCVQLSLDLPERLTEKGTKSNQKC